MPMLTYSVMHIGEIPEEWIPWAVVVVIGFIIGCLAFMIGVIIKDKRR